MPEFKEDRACSLIWKAETRTGRLSIKLQLIVRYFIGLETMRLSTRFNVRAVPGLYGGV